jgi:DhnA family fructose-bisphosphate aldolase class Ia
VLSAGGGQVSDQEFNAFVADVMRNGAQGLAAGRNIFMAADPGAKVCEVKALLEANFGAKSRHRTSILPRAVAELARSN